MAPGAGSGNPIIRFWRVAYVEGITGLAAMVAYNLLLSVFPLVTIALFVASRVLRSPELQRSVILDVQGVFPSATDATLSEALRALAGSSTSVGVIALVSSLWVSASFWGSLDTAFCRIYHLPCRSWVRQKLFALGMLLVVLLFFVATVAVPTLQSLLVRGAADLPFGLADVRGFFFAVSLVAGLLVLFLVMCAIYWRVPKGRTPWACVWPGALGATAAMAVVDYGFPLYLQNISTLARLGPSVIFVFIALVWFYLLAIILLSGAVVNELRMQTRARRAGRTLR